MPISVGEHDDAASALRSLRSGIFSSLFSLAGVSVMLIPNALDKRWAQAGQLTSVTDSEGTFSVTLPPGEYIIELRRISHDPHPPSISKPLLENSLRVTLQPGELKSIEIRIP